MIITLAERVSESPYIEEVSCGHTNSAGSTIRPAERHWHMALVRQGQRFHSVAVGPLPTAGIASWGEGAEILWIKFRLGTFMPQMPFRTILDRETTLPEASSNSFWLNGSTWQMPTYENVETFVEWLVRDEAVAVDPMVNSILQEESPPLASRTVRHRFLRATGLTQNQVYQIERAQRAAQMLRQGMAILDTVYDVGYFDQPHLTRALKQWVGYTPAEIIRRSRPECHSPQQDSPVMDDALRGIA